MKSLPVLALAFGFFAFTAPSQTRADDAFAKIVSVQGNVTLDGGQVVPNQTISTNGLLKTEKNSYARIELLPSRSVLTLNPSSELHLVRPMPDDTVTEELDEGTVRAKINKRPSNTFRIRTPEATFGVRGTEFAVHVNPMMEDKESEVTVFVGIVSVESNSDPKDQQLIGRGQWGGKGGRFGSKVAGPLNVSKSALELYDQQTSYPTIGSIDTSGASTRSKKSHSANAEGDGTSAE